jgi:hypothetical protein
LGVLDVPIGFSADTWNYKEGIVTTLSYKDGSSIVLQRGLMYRIPMFQDPEDVVDSSIEGNERTMRKGHYKRGNKRWGEINYRILPRANSRTSSSIGGFPLNLGYAHVLPKREPAFSKAIASFRPAG